MQRRLCFWNCKKAQAAAPGPPPPGCLPQEELVPSTLLSRDPQVSTDLLLCLPTQTVEPKYRPLRGFVPEALEKEFRTLGPTFDLAWPSPTASQGLRSRVIMGHLLLT